MTNKKFQKFVLYTMAIIMLISGVLTAVGGIMMQ